MVILLALLSTPANSQADRFEYCGSKPCIEPLRTSCEEMMELYEFQGSCCSLETIPATGGCRITVSFGNCFWYPWCGECDDEERKSTSCNRVFETEANQRPCPVADFDPVKLQKAEDFERPSCSPSMAPSESQDGGSGSGSTSLFSAQNTHTNLVGAATVLVVLVAGAMVGA